MRDVEMGVEVAGQELCICDRFLCPMKHKGARQRVTILERQLQHFESCMRGT